MTPGLSNTEELAGSGPPSLRSRQAPAPEGADAHQPPSLQASGGLLVLSRTGPPTEGKSKGREASITQPNTCPCAALGSARRYWLQVPPVSARRMLPGRWNITLSFTGTDSEAQSHKRSQGLLEVRRDSTAELETNSRSIRELGTNSRSISPPPTPVTHSHCLYSVNELERCH